SIVEFCVDRDLFANLALNASAVGRFVQSKKRFVAFVHMTADPDGTFGDEARLARFLAANVVKHFVTMREQRVWNDLLVARISFRVVASQKEIVPARQNCVQIFARLEVQPLKIAELIEQSALNDKNIF